MTAALHTGCLVLGAAILPVLARRFALRRTLPNGAFTLYVGCSALSYLVLLPPVYATIDHATGRLNSAGMLSGLSVLVLTAAQETLLVYWSSPAGAFRRRTSIRVAFFAGLIVAFVGSFILLPPKEQRFEDFYLHYTRHPLEAPYLLVYVTGCIVGQFDVVVHCRRYATVTTHPWIRRGMLVTAAGAALILVYAAVRVLDIVGGQLGVDLHVAEPVAWLCGDLGSALALVGWTLPLAVAALILARTWRERHRTLRCLHPLWSALCQATPEVALAPPHSPLHDLLRVRHLEFWLHRRAIEIQDGLRALRHDIDDALPARDSSGFDRRESLPELLARALLATTGPVPNATDRLVDVADDLAWLCRLSRVFAALESPVPAPVPEPAVALSAVPRL
jgi:hypothetical protein